MPRSMFGVTPNFCKTDPIDFLGFSRRITPELRELVTAEFRPRAHARAEWLAEKDTTLDVTPA